MRALLVVVVEKDVETGTQFVAAVGGVQIDVIVFDRAPEPLDEHVVDRSSDPVHRDGDPGVEQHLHEGVRGELRPLIGVEDLRRAVEGEGLFEGGHAEVTGHGVGEAPGEDLATVPVHDRHEVEETFFERYVSDIGAPNLVRSVDQ